MRRWAVQHGPEFKLSCDALNLPADALERHLAAIHLSLERDPYRYSTAFDVENRRVVQSTDYVGDGFVLTAFVVLCEGFVAEVKWVEAESLPQAEEDS